MKHLFTTTFLVRFISRFCN